MISRIKKISLWVFLSKERLLKAVFKTLSQKVEINPKP